MEPGLLPFPRLAPPRNWGGVRGCRVRSTAPTSCADAAETILNFASLLWQTDQMWVASAPTVITIPHNWPVSRIHGFDNPSKPYLVEMGCMINGTDAGGEHIVRYRCGVNGLYLPGGYRYAEGSRGGSHMHIHPCAPGDQIQARVYQSSGGARNFGLAYNPVTDWWGPTEMWVMLLP